MSQDGDDPRTGALVEELAGYGLLPDCRQPKATRWTQDIVRCGECEGCKLLALAREVIERHLRNDET